jgi:hypothetical protein
MKSFGNLIKLIKRIIKKIIPEKRIIDKANLFIIGAQKCGTSTLYDNLMKYDGIYGGKIKEKNFFSHESIFKQGILWYHNLFPKVSIFYKLPETRYFLDASPSYLAHKVSADKILKYNPNAKFIVMMRNPVDRAFSAWNMYRQMNLLGDKEKEILFEKHIKGSSVERETSFMNLINLKEFPSFESMIQEELNNFSIDSWKFPGILSRGIYYNQIEYYMSLFDSSQFFFIFAEDFKVNKSQILNELMVFLDLQFSISTETLKDTHVREYKHKMTPDTRTKLLDYFKPHNEKLFELINKNINWSN